MNKTIVIGLLAAMLAGVPLKAATAESSLSHRQLEALTLEQAMEIAERLQPELAEARASVEAAEGRAREAGAFPNPEAIVGAQQLPLNGPNDREYVAGVGQILPLSGRLAKARQAELLDREVRVRGLEVRRRDVRKRVHSAFATALYQEKAHEAQSAIVQNAEKAVATTRARVEAGDIVREDLARAEMELARAKVEWKRAASLREQGRLELASAMGEPALSVSSLAGTLETTFEIPTLESLMARLSDQPQIAQGEADIRARNARLDLAKAERIPDVKVEVLYHRLEATKSDTLDLGLSIPLPLFNRKQGRLRETRAEVAAAEARAQMSRNEMTARLRQSHMQLTAALANSSALKNDVMPRAETVLKGAEARYAAGDISLAEVLPIRRDWAVLQLTYLDSLREIVQAWSELKSFTRY
ncbi:MAG TPA: TolC family protein [Clostridia bacterium]|nr:TolC family protein [Clostridia bacterium]